MVNVGMNSADGGLNPRVRESAKPSIFIGTYVGKRIALGLSPGIDVSLARARDRAGEIRTKQLDGKDLRADRTWAKPDAEATDKQVSTFCGFAKVLVADIEDSFKNPQHRPQWGNTLDSSFSLMRQRELRGTRRWACHANLA